MFSAITEYSIECDHPSCTMVDVVLTGDVIDDQRVRSKKDAQAVFRRLNWSIGKHRHYCPFHSGKETDGTSLVSGLPSDADTTGVSD